MIHTRVLLVTQRSLEAYTATYTQHKVVRPWLGANLHCISQHTTESSDSRPYHTGRLCRQFLQLIAKTSDKLAVGKTFL